MRSVHDRLTPEQRHALGQAARVVAGDDGVGIVRAAQKCEEDPDRLISLGKAIQDAGEAVAAAQTAIKADTPADAEAPAE